MMDALTFLAKFGLWAIVTLSILGMTFVPLSLFLEMVWKQRRDKKSR